MPTPTFRFDPVELPPEALIIRGEVRYTDFGKNNINFAGSSLRGRFNDTTTTLGVSYKF